MRIVSMVCLVFAMLSTEMAKAENPKNFTLQAALSDDKFDLQVNKGKTVVLHFLLKTECPFCLKYTNEYALLAATTPEVVHLFIKPDSVDEIKDWASNLDKTGLSGLPKIYRDPGAKLAKQFGIPNGYKFHGQTVHYPAMVVLDGDGKEMFRYVGKSNSDRMAKSDFNKKLDSMMAK